MSYLVEDDGRQHDVKENVRVEVELLAHPVVHHQPHRQTCARCPWAHRRKKQ